MVISLKEGPGKIADKWRTGGVLVGTGEVGLTVGIPSPTKGFYWIFRPIGSVVLYRIAEAE
jgi:hypothetical protein